MTTITYDGKKHAAEIKAEVKKKIAVFKKETGITPTLTIVKVNHLASTETFTKLKEKAAEEVGSKVEIYNVAKRRTHHDVAVLVRTLCEDPENHGVMIQLPFPRLLKKHADYLLNKITTDKDVDGLADKSEFVKPVAKAVLNAVEDYRVKTKNKRPKILVIGSEGSVGKDVVKLLDNNKMDVVGLDQKSFGIVGAKVIRKAVKGMDLIVTATGKKSLLGNYELQERVAVIDVGAPDPELNVKQVKDRLTYYTPVPGGIGPVTIAYLLENLYEAAYNQTRRKSHT